MWSTNVLDLPKYFFENALNLFQEIRISKVPKILIWYCYQKFRIKIFKKLVLKCTYLYFWALAVLNNWCITDKSSNIPNTSYFNKNRSFFIWAIYQNCPFSLFDINLVKLLKEYVGRSQFGIRDKKKLKAW